MKFTFSTTLLLFFSILLFAQDNCEKFQKEAITYVRPYAFFKGGQSYKSGLFYGKLKKELEVSPMALAEFKKYKTNRNLGFAFVAASLGSLLAAPFADDRRLQSALLIGSLGFSIGSIRFSLDATDNLHRAVWMRNEDILRAP